MAPRQLEGRRGGGEGPQRERPPLCTDRYAAYRFFGSPSSRYDLSPTSHIVEVDGAPTPDLAAFLACTRKKRDGEVLRVKYVDLEGRCRMTTLKLDLKYWPTFALERDAEGEWRRRDDV